MTKPNKKTTEKFKEKYKVLVRIDRKRLPVDGKELIR